jgi:hypothetical protein
MPRFDLANYVPVQERITEFWRDHPDGAIRTSLASDPADWTKCRYRAEVYTHRDHPQPDATGYAFEVAGGGGANSTSHEENGETSSIGRALANLGYATSQQTRPSREEMTKVSRDTTRPAPAPQAAPQAPQQPTPIESKAPRTQAQFEEIQTLIDATQSDAERICQLYRIGSLGDLTRATADHLIATLRTKAAKLAEASS